MKVEKSKWAVGNAAAYQYDQAKDRRHTISLHCGPDCWLADMRSAPDASHIKELFGTHWLPTAFTPKATFSRVAPAIARLNPGAEIKEGRRLTAHDLLFICD